MSSKNNILKNINSNYIIKHIFSFLENRLFMDIIRNNKKMQKKLEISLETYENLCPVIIEKKRDNFSFSFKDDNIYRAYTKDKQYVIFEGKYLHGKKNGYGTEFYLNKKKKFQGEYLNGIKINGTGYDKLGNIIYKIDSKNVTARYKNQMPVFNGKYYNGKKWNGIGYDINGNEVYEIKYGRGFVKEYYDDGVLKFEGEYFNGERNGKGKKYDYEQEIKFEGIYKNGEKWNGKGKEYYTDHDEENDVDPNQFKIDLFAPKKKEPSFSDIFKPKPLAIFSLFEKKEDPLIGNIMKNTFKNHNIERVTNNNFGHNLEEKVLKYEGEYLNGKRHGKGKEFTKNKILVYEGEYQNGLWHGKGKQYNSDKISYGLGPQLLYEGEFKFGKWDGKGKEYETGLLYIDKRIKHEGNFVKGKFVS